MTDPTKILLPEDRYFDPDPTQKRLALELYRTVANLPLVCPHGHVDPRLFADPDYNFGSPTELLIIPDHYVFRMLYSQGISLDDLGVPHKDGSRSDADHRQVWQVFADNFHLFRGTPTGVWLTDELATVFDIKEKLTSDSAQSIYDQIAEKLKGDNFRPRRLYERFNIEVLCTTDAATDPLTYHQAIKDSGWSGRILPTFRPDAVVNLGTEGWRANIDALSEVSGIEVSGYKSFIAALENRRAFFKSMGAQATDHAATSPYTEILSPSEAELIFQRALRGEADPEDARRFTGHMLVEMARMSIEDGLVMQLHPGSFRNHNASLYDQFGPDKGADIPMRGEYTRNMLPLLRKFGNDSRLTLILFTLDEGTASREMAPLAGHYPVLKLGPPWWFYDSWNGIRRFFDDVMETAGLYNTAGFNDDTRAYPSIPTRHDLWRRAAANWIAGLLVRNFIDREDAEAMIHDAAYGLAKKAYNL